MTAKFNKKMVYVMNQEPSIPGWKEEVLLVETPKKDITSGKVPEVISHYTL